MTSLNSPKGGMKGQPIAFEVNALDWEQARQYEDITRTGEPQKPVAVLSRDIKTDMSLTASVAQGIIRETPADATSQGGATHGTTFTALGDAESFGVSAYSYDSSDAWGTQTPDVMYNEQVELINNVWTLHNVCYWPADVSKTVRFFAYAPYDTGAMGMVHSASDHAGPPTIQYTVPTTVTNQIDLMTAASNPINYTGLAVNLPFKHALTCVRFSVGTVSLPGKIVRISLKNVVKSGTYTFGGGWTPSTATNDSATFHIINLNFPFSGYANNVIRHLNNDGTAADNGTGSTLLMIPQTFNSDKQVVEMEYNDGTTNHILQAKLTGTTWEPGTTVTYCLSSNSTTWEYTFEASSVTGSHSGGDAQFAVSSYRTNTGGTTEAVPWEVIGYSADGTTWTERKPACCNWAGIVTTSGTGGLTPQYAKVRFDAQSPTGSSTFSDESTGNSQMRASMIARANARQQNVAVSGNPLDLSTHDQNGNPTLRNTANCYVVNAPGVYKFPLVYGNGIKNGQPNTQAYASATFVDHLNQSITDPYIYNKYTARRAQLLWQDLPNSQSLITDVTLTDDGRAVQFTVTEANIKQGNAVIAVYDAASGGSVIWSWHIWVTGVDINSTIQVDVASFDGYYFMPINLGWVARYGTLYNYEGRTMWVKLQQNSGKTATIALSQLAGPEMSGTTLGTCTMYQWGRKDPCTPISGTSTANREVSGSVTPTFPTGQIDYYQSITNPTKFYYSTSQNKPWCKVFSHDTWHATSAAYGWPFSIVGWAGGMHHERGEKTIYDPCPPGFHIPECFALSGFGDQGWFVQEYKSAANLLTTGSYNYGYNFANNWTRQTSIFIPINGYRHINNLSIATFGTNNIWSGYLTNRAISSTSFSISWFKVDYYWGYHEDLNSSRAAYVRPVADVD